MIEQTLIEVDPGLCGSTTKRFELIDTEGLFVSFHTETEADEWIKTYTPGAHTTKKLAERRSNTLTEGAYEERRGNPIVPMPVDGADYIE